jgi:hypothetical protein
MFIATFNNVSVIHCTCALGTGVQEAHVFATFNIVLVIYHSFVVGRGVQQTHVVCHF